jgi:thermitase
MMSRKNLTIAGLLTAIFTVTLLTFTMRPGDNHVPRQASVPGPRQEKILKKPLC